MFYVPPMDLPLYVPAGTGADFPTGTGRFGMIGTTSIPVPGTLDKFGTASIPVPDTSISSVQHQYRYRTLR